MTFDAFISYSSRDKTAADATCALLESAGIRCWIAPRDIRPGAEYGGAIIDAIDRCHVMILVFSSSANESQQIHREIERAVAKGVPILPLRIEDVTPTKSLEYFLGAIHWLDAIRPPIEKHLQELAETVKAILKIDPGSRNSQTGAGGGTASVPAAAGDAARAAPPRNDDDKAATGRPHGTKRRSWLVPAAGAAVLLALIAGGVWLYQAARPPPANPTAWAPSQALPATLRAAARARDFLVGSAAFPRALRDDPIYAQVLAKEFNLLEPEGIPRFKWAHPTRSEYNFTDHDAVIDFAQAHAMGVRGYPLVVTYDLPDWLTKGGLPPGEISAILKDYVQTVLRRYRGRVYAWDIASGVFDNLGHMRETIWSRAIGPDYLEQVFGWAREADPQVKLFFNNDYAFEPLGGSSDATYELMRKFRARGVPIDGIAMSSTSLLTRLPKLQDVVTNMSRLAGLGLEIHVDHFEMSVPVPASDQDLQRQATAYRDYLTTCLSITTCRAFVTWGFTDKHSFAPERWKGMAVGAAMPFDAAYKPKPAYQAMMEALSDRRADAR